MAEMFTMQRYLQRTLEEAQPASLDGLAATFGEPVTAMELSPEGAGYRLNTRFARFHQRAGTDANFRQTADVQTRRCSICRAQNWKVKSPPSAMRRHRLS